MKIHKIEAKSRRLTSPILISLGKSGLFGQKLKNAMLKTPDGAFRFAKYVLRGRCVEAEPMIKTDEGTAYLYAIEVMHLDSHQETVNWGSEVWGPLKKQQQTDTDRQWEAEND